MIFVLVLTVVIAIAVTVQGLSKHKSLDPEIAKGSISAHLFASENQIIPETSMDNILGKNKFKLASLSSSKKMDSSNKKEG